MSPEEKIRLLTLQLEEATQKSASVEKALQNAEEKIRGLEAELLLSRTGSSSGPKQRLVWLLRHPKIYPLTTLLLENLIYALLIYDVEGKIVLMNRQFSELLAQVHSDDSVGKPLEIIKDDLLQHLINPSQLEDFLQSSQMGRNHKNPIDLELLNGMAINFQEIPLWKDGDYLGAMWIAYNITQNVKNAKQLQEQQKFYEDILNHLPEDIAVLDSEERYLFVNPLGIKDDGLRKMILGKTDLEFARMRGKNEKIALERKQLIQRIRETGEVIQWEEEFKLPDGSMEYFQRKMFPVSDEQGRVKYFIGYGLNISDRKKMEKRASDLLVALEKLGDNFWEYDFTTGALYVSRNNLYFPELEGKSVDEVRNIWYAKIHPDDVGEMYKMGELYSLGLQEQHSVEFRMKYLDGEYRWVLDRGLAIEKSPDGKVLKVLGIHTDISYIKNLQLEKDRTSRRYQDLIEYSLAMIFTHDLQGNLLSSNPAVARILGYEEQEIAGKNVINFMPEEYRSEIKQKYFSAIEATGKSEGVVRVYSKNGKKIYFLYQNFKRVDEYGIPYIICFAQDITKRIEAEKELKHAKKHSEDVARAKENFLATMSHEIRTPMNGVMGITDLLAKTNLDSQQKQYINLIQESSQNLLMIVNDVLDLEKIVLGKLQFENITFSLSERIGMCVQSFNYKALEKGLEMRFVNCLKDQLYVVSDPYRLSQLMNNLISNAIKFTERGRITIELFPIEQQGNKWLIGCSINDTGIGIPEEKLSEIFEPFVQVSSSVSRMYGGTGLGLSICNQLIQMMGGHFEVNSELGKGSEFRFSIPFEISSKIPADHSYPIAIDLKLLGRKKVLLVEDVELNQYLARHIMESWGFQVVVAANGKEAIAMIESQRFDLVLMDIQMPVMDGLEATRIIRGMKDTQKSSIPIIALTANALRGDSEQYLSQGMNDYLPKPFDEMKLYLKITGVLGINLAAVQPEQQNGYPMIDSSELKPLFDLAVLNSMADGDEAFVKEMLSMFVATMPVYLMELSNYMEKKDWVNTSRTAHKIKASLHTMCISVLYDVIQEIEDIGKSRKSKKNLPGLVNQVAEVTHQAIKEMEAMIAG